MVSAAQHATPSIPVSWGELFDKITILRIKAARLREPAQLANVRRELALLEAASAAAGGEDGLAPILAELQAINEALWQIEDDIRDHERARDFGDGFVALARSVYRQNDRRADAKRRINDLLGSLLVEEKSYHAY